MAQSGSNISCPCGSGKPIKDCCFADAINSVKNEFLNRASNQYAPLTKDSITQIAREITQRQKAYNASPIDDFCGLSPEQMSDVLYKPFESTGVVRINPNCQPARKFDPGSASNFDPPQAVILGLSF